jgi:TPR repeat protein
MTEIFNSTIPFDSAIELSRQKFVFALQSALRFSDLATLAAIREVGLSCLPSAVAQLPPLLPNVRWVQRAAFAGAAANFKTGTNAPNCQTPRDPCAQAWLAALLCQERAVAEFYGVDADFAKLVKDCWPSLQRLAAQGDAEAALRLGVLLDPSGPRGWSIAGEAAKILAASNAIFDTTASAAANAASTSIDTRVTDNSMSSRSRTSCDMNDQIASTDVETGATRLSAESATVSKRAASKLDIAMAEFWLRRAADAGSAEACHRLSLLLWQRRKADKGNGRGRAAARATAAMAGSSSGGRTAHGAEARRLLRRAANGGCSSALVLAASKVAQDEHISPGAAESAGVAASLGIADAAYRLGDPTALGIQADDAMVARSDFSKALFLNMRAAAAVVGPTLPNLWCHSRSSSNSTTSAVTSSATAFTATPRRSFIGGDCLCTTADTCNCLPGLALSRVGRAAAVRLVDFFQPIDDSCDAKMLWLRKEGVSNAAAERLSLLWVARAGSDGTSHHDYSSKRSSNNKDYMDSSGRKSFKSCTGHTLGSPPAKEMKVLSANDSSADKASSSLSSVGGGKIGGRTAPTENGASSVPKWSVAEVVKRHECNAGRPLVEISSCGNYFNLLKVGLRAEDVPATMAAFVLARQVSKVAQAESKKDKSDENNGESGNTSSGSCIGGTSRLGLSHNVALGAEGATLLADHLMQTQDYAGYEDIVFKPVPGQCSDSAIELNASNQDITLHLEQAPREPIGTWLSELFMSECNVGPSGANALAAALPSCMVLKKLGLNYNNIGDDGAVALLYAITESTRVWKSAATSSSTKLRTQNLGLHTLGLIGNGLTDRAAFAAAACLCGRSQLDSNDISDSIELSNTKSQKQLESVSLPPTNAEETELFGAFESDAVNNASSEAALAGSNREKFTSLCPLRRLYFNENAIGDDGAQALAQALQEAASLTRRLHSNSCLQPIASNGARPFSGAETERDQNEVGARGTSISAQSSTASSSSVGGKNQKNGIDLASSLCLERLGLSDNAIGTSGGIALLGALTHGQCSLDKLCCSDNRWNVPTQRALCCLPNVFAGAKVTQLQKFTGQIRMLGKAESFVLEYTFCTTSTQFFIPEFSFSFFFNNRAFSTLLLCCYTLFLCRYKCSLAKVVLPKLSALKRAAFLWCGNSHSSARCCASSCELFLATIADVGHGFHLLRLDALTPPAAKLLIQSTQSIRVCPLTFKYRF